MARMILRTASYVIVSLDILGTGVKMASNQRLVRILPMVSYVTAQKDILGSRTKNSNIGLRCRPKKSQPSDQRIMPEIFRISRSALEITSFPALSVESRIGISRSASETNDRFCLS